MAYADTARAAEQGSSRLRPAALGSTTARRQRLLQQAHRLTAMTEPVLVVGVQLGGRQAEIRQPKIGIIAKTPATARPQRNLALPNAFGYRRRRRRRSRQKDPNTPISCPAWGRRYPLQWR